jgi:integrase
MNKRVLSNPCRYVTKPKTKKHKHIILSIDKYAELLQSATGTPMYIPILLAGYMGLRKEESLGLAWPAVNFKEKTIKICQVRQMVNGKEIMEEPKTEKSNRTLDMPEIVVKALSEHKNNIVIDISHQLVCSETIGKPLSINTFARRYKRALQAAGLDTNIRYHDLRHTTAAFLVKAGASLKEVSYYLGHENIAISMDLYADIYEESKKAIAQKLDELIQPYLKS